MQLKVKLGYDDALDAFGVHGIGGIVGGILVCVSLCVCVYVRGVGLLLMLSVCMGLAALSEAFCCHLSPIHSLYTNTHTHTHVYVCVCMYVCM